MDVTRSRMTSKGQITVPLAIRRQFDLEPGDILEFRVQGDELRVRPVKSRAIEDFQGMFRVAGALDHAEERRIAWDDRAAEIEANPVDPDA